MFWVEVIDQNGSTADWVTGKAAPWQKCKGPGSDAKSHAPGRLRTRLPPVSSPSQPAQQGPGGQALFVALYAVFYTH